MQRFKCKNANPKKVETRGFSRCPNPVFGFGKMSGVPGSGFSKPGLHIIVILADQRCNVAIGLLPNWYLLCTEVVCTKIVCIKEAVQIFKISNRIVTLVFDSIQNEYSYSKFSNTYHHPFLKKA